MKKALVLVLAIAMLATLFAGCTTTAPVAPSQTAAPVATQEVKPTEVAPASPAVTEAAPTSGWPAYKDKIYIGVAIRSLSNPYHASVKQGAEQLGADLKAAGYDVEVNTMECNGSDDTQVSQIKALIARGGENTVLYVDPNNAPNSSVIAQICEDAHVYWSSVWNLAEGDYPMNYNYWVSHSSPDDVQCGYDTAVALFKSFKTPGTGKILAIEGMLANTASQNRSIGLKKAMAEYPNIEMLDIQPADWDTTKALNLTQTWLSKYKDIDGIWAADDTMALGVVTALQNAGMNGKIGVTGDAATTQALDAIKKGDMTATWDVAGLSQGYYATAWALAAKLGVLKVTDSEVSDRMFLTAGSLVTAQNVDSIGKTAKFNYMDYKAFNVGPMENNWTKK